MVQAGAGNDIIHLGDAQFNVFGGAGFDTVHTKVDYFPQRDIEKIVGVGTASIFINLQGRDEPGDITGNAGANKIFAGFGNDTVRGGAGADELHGARGSDNLFGDAGNDTIYGDAGTVVADRFHATVGMGQDTIADFQLQFDKIVGATGASIAMSGSVDSIITHSTGSFKLLGVYWTQLDLDNDTFADDIRVENLGLGGPDTDFLNKTTPDISLFVL